ncbi:hypothetical protein FRC01_010556, partial [Tulasnella sp. 417]
MSHLDFSEDDLVDAMSTFSPTSSEVDAQSLAVKSPTRPSTPKPPVDLSSPATEEIGELRHAKFHISRFVVIQVESTLYRVPRALIENSEAYKDQIPPDETDGTLYVDGISTGEMEAFLDVSDAR